MTVASFDVAGVHSALPPGAQSEQANARLDMNLKRLRWLAAAAPLAIVMILEVVRFFTIGSVAVPTRVALDAVVVIAFAIFGIIMVRTIGAMQDRLKRQNRELLALHTAGLDVASELSLDIVLKKVVDQARNLVGARYGALSVVNDDGTTIRAFLTSGITPEQRAAIGPPPVGHGVLGVVLHEGQRLRLEDLSKHPRSVGFPPNHPPMKTLLAVPITCKSPFIGNLYLAEKEGAAQFTPDDEETLERFAVQAAIAIDNAHLHQQVASLAVAQERLRIAHEMHDGLAQVLGYVNTKSQAVEQLLSAGRLDEAREHMAELGAAARSVYVDVREAILGLRSPITPGLGLAGAIADYAKRFSDASKIQVSVTATAAGRAVQLDGGVEAHVFRIVQESLTNVRKHSGASRVTIGLDRAGDALEVRLSDDGRGFVGVPDTDADWPRYGLAAMRERAEAIGATLRLSTGSAGGGVVTLAVPIRRAAGVA